jgi:hypothetical protein
MSSQKYQRGQNLPVTFLYVFISFSWPFVSLVTHNFHIVTIWVTHYILYLAQRTSEACILVPKNTTNCCYSETIITFSNELRQFCVCVCMYVKGTNRWYRMANRLYSGRSSLLCQYKNKRNTMDSSWHTQHSKAKRR